MPSLGRARPPVAAQPASPAGSRGRRGGRREAITQLVDALARADVSELSVDAVSSGLNLSVRHFRRLFRAQTGRSFHTFLTELRVAHAKELLTRSDRKIIEVAWECGYGSLSQFNLVFRRKTGVTPGQYRARARGGILRGE